MHPRSTRWIGNLTKNISRAAVVMDRLVHKVRRTCARAHYSRARKTAKTNRRRDNPLQCSAGYRSVSDTGPHRRHRARSPRSHRRPARLFHGRSRAAHGYRRCGVGRGVGEHRRLLGLRSSYPFSLRLPMWFVYVCVCVFFIPGVPFDG